MATQLLVNVLTVSALVPGGTVTLPHGLVSNGRGALPKLVQPDRTTPIAVTAMSTSTITFRNDGGTNATANFRASCGLSLEGDPAGTPAFVWQGNADAAGVLSLDVTSPVTNTGTPAAPNIGVAVGTAAGTVCAGNDSRLSDQRIPVDGSVTAAKVAAANRDGTAATPSMRTLGTGATQACAGNDTRLADTRTPTPLSPSPATVFTERTVPVLTINSAGQVTSASSAPRSSQYVNDQWPSASGTLATSPVIIRPVSGVINVTIPDNSRASFYMSYFGSSTISNTGGTGRQMSVSMGYLTGGGSYIPLAEQSLYVPANSTVTLPTIFNAVPQTFPVTCNDLQLRLICSVGASLNYSIMGPASFVRIMQA